MSLLQSLFSPRRPSPPTDDKKELKELEQAMAEKKGEARANRDQTARIAAFLRCQQEGKDKDCRINISWEELAAEGISNAGPS